jgi:heme-degrading monooxygenase HmoA
VGKDVAMSISSEYLASGNWLIKEGREQEFIDRWKAFLDWSRGNPGFLWAKLMRQEGSGRHFISFSIWRDAQARANWKAAPGFAERFNACRELTDEFSSGDYDLEVNVSAKGIETSTGESRQAA